MRINSAITRRISAVTISAVSLIALAATPASAGVHWGDGQPSYWYNCSTGDHRVASHGGWAATSSMYRYAYHGSPGQYLGWVEWRYNGSCAYSGGYQWLRMHFTQPFVEHFAVNIARMTDSPDGNSNPKVDHIVSQEMRLDTRQAGGEYIADSPILWAPYNLICIYGTGWTMDPASPNFTAYPDSQGTITINARDHNTNGRSNFCG